MPMSFEKHFTKSIEFRSQFDPGFQLDTAAMTVLESTFRQTSEKSMQEPFFGIRQRVCALANEYASGNSVEAFSYQCLADSHVFLQACVEQQIVNEKYMTLTVGDVSYKGNRLFNADRLTMEAVVSKGISTQDEPLFHVWLTLADMTVIDLTIIRQLQQKQLIPAGDTSDQPLHVWRAERPGQFDYFPILVDDDFLSRLQKVVH